MKIIHLITACFIIILSADLSFGNSIETFYRWRNDDGDVYSATWKDSLSTPIVLTNYENLRLRIKYQIGQAFSSDISLGYTEDPSGSWIPISRSDTGKFIISPSKYLHDTMAYFDNELLPMPEDSHYKYEKTITFDSTDKYHLVCNRDRSFYEFEFSLKATMNIKPGSAYFFTLFENNTPMTRDHGDGRQYATLMTPPVSWSYQTFTNSYQYSDCYLNDLSFVNASTGTVVGNDYYSGNLILRTTNGGLSWTKQHCPAEDCLRAVCFTDADIGTIVGDNGVILKTTNGGQDWIVQNSGLYYNSYDLSYVFFTGADTGIVLGKAKEGKYNSIILRTTDGGNTWTKQIVPNLEYSGVHFFDSNLGYAVGKYGFVMKTIDGGHNWSAQSIGTILASLNDVFPIDINNAVAVGYYNADDSLHTSRSVIIKTSDGGNTWTKALYVPGRALRSVYFINKNTGWAVGEYGLIYKTTDGGQNWKKLVSGVCWHLTAVQFTDLNTGWTIGELSNNILKTTNGGSATFVEDKIHKNITNNFYLSQNYPNPFNPSTTIEYTLAKSGKVSLEIYDVLGRLVNTVVNKWQTAGDYKINWSAKNLPSGIYFYKLKSGEYIEAKKMLLIR